jgi:hypothetical protein
LITSNKCRPITWQKPSSSENSASTSDKLLAIIHNAGLDIADKNRIITPLISQGARVTPCFFHAEEEILLIFSLNLLTIFFLYNHKTLLSVFFTVEAVIFAICFHLQIKNTALVSETNGINCFKNLEYYKNAKGLIQKKQNPTAEGTTKTEGTFTKRAYNPTKHSTAHQLLNFLVLDARMPSAELIKDDAHLLDTKAFMTNSSKYTTLRRFLEQSPYNRDKLVLEKIVSLLSISRRDKIRRQRGDRFEFR